MVEIRQRFPTQADIAHLAANLREQDRVELRAGGRENFHEVVASSVARSAQAWALFAGDDLACICGVAPIFGLLGDTGAPWLLGTDVAPRHARALMRRAQAYIRVMLDSYPVLFNAVHAENTVSVAWLRHMGFEIAPARPHPATGAMFHPFTMRADHV